MINWRKGLFRLWIISSTFWIVSIGVLFFNEYNNAHNKESRLKYIVSEIKNPKKALSIIREEFPELRQQNGFVDLGPAFGPPEKESKEDPEKLAQKSPKNGVVAPKGKFIPEDEFILGILEEICKKAENDRKDKIYRFFIFSIIPPILLLIIGSAIYWALRGFRP